MITHNARFMRLGHAWTPASAAVDPAGAYLDFNGVHEWFSRTEAPTPVAAGRGGSAAYVVQDSGGNRLHEVVTHDEVDLPPDLGGAQSMATDAGVTYQLAQSPDGAIVEDLGAAVLPVTAFVGPDSRIVELRSGGLDQSDLQSDIQEHFGT